MTVIQHVGPRLRRKNTPALIEALGHDEFEGYASLFNVPDGGGDVVAPGAFARSLRKRPPERVRMLYQHFAHEPIGVWEEIREDQRGLYVRGRLIQDVERARDVTALINKGALNGLSIGFRTIRASRDRASGIRKLLEIELWEISIVTFPLLPGSEVTGVGVKNTLANGLRARVPRSGTGNLFHRLADPRGSPRRRSMELETKDVEIKSAFDDFLRAFEAFKGANDERLAALERRSADVLSEEKVERINRALDEHKRALDDLTIAQARPALGAETKAPRETLARKSAFDRYVRKGDTAGLDQLELKAMSAGVPADGGFTVPLEIEQTIDRILAKASPIRGIATVRQIGSNVYRKPIAIQGAATGWVAETDARVATAAPTLAAIDYPAMELYAMPAATATLLDDSQVDIEQWLAGEVQIVFAEQEGAAFVSGNGTTQPKGFLSETVVADASWSWGKLGYIASGADGAFATSNPSDALVTLAYAPKQGYRANGTFVMNRKTESVIRKFKDNVGNYIWQPSAAAGQPPTLFGYPVAEAEDMPDIASGSFSIAFGDFARGYLVVDRVGIRTLRDPYSAKPYVLFYTTKRVGGGVQNFEAIKLMKFSAS